ncbi:MAG TPA: UDP-3-O-(3-hydroxymyristoyl)glucosamine N-acyltransferase [Candidatus Binatia bacterium]|nr:UDP-3-O-(3-hydroxymyristoyl)glucosamine N-acyltransferase [Candidatus Binatia bacterium]
MTTVRKTLFELAEIVGGKVIGDGNAEIWKAASIEEAGPGDITFLANPRYATHLKSCEASAVIVGAGAATAAPPRGRGYLEVANPYLAFARVLALINPPSRYDAGVSPLASVHSTAKLADGVKVFPFVYISEGVSVGRGTVLFPGVFLGEGASVGAACVLHPNVTVREQCRIGDRVVLHAGVVVGADGFGYAGEGAARMKIPQVGVVEIGDDVEIGANATIDRATLGKTIIGRGTKIDNLVQIAHNVVVGERAIIAAQAGVAGSTRIGNDVILAGQAGVVNHVSIGDGAKVGPKSGIARAVPPGAVVSGALEAGPHQEWIKVMALVPRLPELWNEVREIKRRLGPKPQGGKKGVKGHARRQRNR